MGESGSLLHFHRIQPELPIDSPPTDGGEEGARGFESGSIHHHWPLQRLILAFQYCWRGSIPRNKHLRNRYDHRMRRRDDSIR